jgi:hypothetical protein
LAKPREEREPIIWFGAILTLLPSLVTEKAATLRRRC